MVDREEAIAFFQAKGEKYKAQLIQDLPATETITLYRQGDWVDLCAEGRYMRTSAGMVPGHAVQADEGRRRLLARRSAQRACFQRIYGTAWRE